MTTTPDTTAPAPVLEFTRLPDRGVTLTAVAGEYRATVTLVVPGSTDRLPTYLWVVADDPANGPAPACYGLGYGRGSAVAAAEATHCLAQLGAGPFAGFTVRPVTLPAIAGFTVLP